jgi:hypothetical protein
LLTSKWSEFDLSADDDAHIATLGDRPHNIGPGGARQLRRLCRVVRPRVIVEVGTYEGMSTRALLAQTCIYTCDSGPERTRFTDTKIETMWNTQSFEMLRDLHEANVGGIDLVFYDACVKNEDPELLRKLMHFETVFAFHDYVEGKKGMRGVRAVLPLVPKHRLIVPRDEDKSASVAVLAPEHIAREIAG